MKFTITRERLHEGLTAVAASVPTKTTLPVLSNILLEASGDGIRLAGTDLDTAVSTAVPAEVDEEGAVTLPARKLVEIVRELPSAAIRVTTSGEQRINLECGRSRFKLLGIPKDEFPSFPPVSFDRSWSVTSSDLQKLIHHVTFAASTEESRPILNGVLWEQRGDQMRMVATNGHRLAKMEIPVSGSDASEEISKSDNHLGFRSASTQVFTRLIEGPYPNYEQVIPRENDKAATIDKEALAGALRRVGVVASDQTHRVRLSFSGAMLKFSVSTPDLGEAQDEIAITYDGDALEIGFNANYLLEVLKYMPTDEVRFTFSAPERATTVEPVGWDDSASYVCLVMPLRLVD
jgi:DNA polymerase-3 subunit beta